MPGTFTSIQLHLVFSKSSGWIRKTFPAMKAFKWQDGSGAFSVSPSMSDAAKSYIGGQKQQHRNREFKAELIALLDAHAMEYDERWLWD